jgi:hypothetical protein
MSPAGVRHDQIEGVRWIETGAPAVHDTSRQAVARWIISGGDRAFIGAGPNRVEVDVIRVVEPYLQTRDGGMWTDDLLGLPRY